MKLKLQKPIIFFDLETTGVDLKKDRIVEIAAVKIFPDGHKEEKCRRFNPGIPIPPDATAVHKITDEDVKDAPMFAQVARGTTGIGAFFADCDLGGYNIERFDIPLLKAEFARAGVDLNISGADIVDAFRIFASRERRDLTAALKFYCGEEHDDAHSALGDVNATIRVLEGQMERYEDLPDSPGEIDKSMRDPDDIDKNGKLRWAGDVATIAFGKHKGKSLEQVVAEDREYISWIIDNKVIDQGVEYLVNALEGKYTRRPSQ